MYFVLFSHQTVIISLCSINWLVFSLNVFCDRQETELFTWLWFDNKY